MVQKRYIYNFLIRGVADKLQQESGLHIQSSAVDQLYAAISTGAWEEAIKLVQQIEFTAKTPRDIISMILELKYLELVQSSDIKEALCCLRTELRDKCEANRYRSF